MSRKYVRKVNEEERKHYVRPADPPSFVRTVKGTGTSVKASSIGALAIAVVLGLFGLFFLGATKVLMTLLQPVLIRLALFQYLLASQYHTRSFSPGSLAM